MEDFKFEIGDLVKLRDDLEDGKKYGFDCYIKDMNFEGFKKIEKLAYNGKFAIICNSNFQYRYTKEMIAEVKRPTKYKTIYKREEPILDNKEKEYLGNLIRPFRDRIEYIVKLPICEEKEFISINLKNDTSYLPNFKKDTMYKNMKLEKYYTLEELGL